MTSSKMLLTLALFTAAYALPTPQLAGEGAAANSVFSSTDNGVGFGTENALDNAAALISGTKSGSTSSAGGSSAAPPPPPPPARRQLGGEGAASNSVFSSTDNGVGFGLEDALDNLAALIGSTRGGVPARRSLDRRQLDKIAKGVQQVSNALGTGSSTSSTTDELVNLDGQLTSGAANLGAQVGSAEESTLEGAGNAIPKRQLDKIAKGVQTLSNALGTGAATSSVTNGLVNVDGTLTSGAANIGADVGSTEEATLEEAGSSVPTSL